MSASNDLELARALQAEYDLETAQKIDNEDVLFDPSLFSTPVRSGPVVKANETMSIVDERWEMLDPSPDARAMFMEFNERYFWGRLAGVEVRWSPRMTLCAGLCCYEGHGGLCSVRLSAPLLKLRPRKDLVETLLHEMIHAYLFVTANNKDHDGHGPEFCKHMKRINTATGTNITIYHSFHEEVDMYRQHWWKCNGPCQKKPPYFGIVKRAMNRPPAPRDTWWGDHQRSCGGTYTKIKEPEGYGQKKGSKRKMEASVENHEQENGAKRRATSSPDKSSHFPGKGNILGSGTSKPPSRLQKWIAEGHGNKNNTSAPTAKPKPPASLGAPPHSPPSKHFSDSHKQTKPEATLLQKWLSKDPARATTISTSSASSSATSTSVPSLSKVEGAIQGWKDRAEKKDNRGNVDGIIKDVSGRRVNGKHSRKGSGKREILLAIFDSDSDSDEFFPHTKKSNGTSSTSTTDSSASCSNHTSSSKSGSNLTNNSSEAVQVKKKNTSAFHHPNLSVTGNPNLSYVRPNMDSKSSKVMSPKDQPDSARSKNNSSRSNVTSPSKQNKHARPSIESSRSTVASPTKNNHTKPDIDSSRSRFTSPNKQQNSARPNSDSPRSKDTLPGEQNNAAKQTSASFWSKVISPSNQQNPVRYNIDNARSKVSSPGVQLSADLGSTASGSSFIDSGSSAFESDVHAEPSRPSVTNTVQCPVCCTHVAELDINAHLDMCLC